MSQWCCHIKFSVILCILSSLKRHFCLSADSCQLNSEQCKKEIKKETTVSKVWRRCSNGDRKKEMFRMFCPQVVFRGKAQLQGGITHWVSECVSWALLTPASFRITQRYRERPTWQGRRWWMYWHRVKKNVLKLWKNKLFICIRTWLWIIVESHDVQPSLEIRLPSYKTLFLRVCLTFDTLLTAVRYVTPTLAVLLLLQLGPTYHLGIYSMGALLPGAGCEVLGVRRRRRWGLGSQT